MVGREGEINSLVEPGGFLLSRMDEKTMDFLYNSITCRRQSCGDPGVGPERRCLSLLSGPGWVDVMEERF